MPGTPAPSYIRDMRILFLGDIMGRPGRKLVLERAPELRRELSLDLILANAENASAGLGLSARNAAELLEAVDLLTTGNHVWKYKDLVPVLQSEPRLLRPMNFPEAPGRGLAVLRPPDLPPVAVLNLQGRVFMDPIDCPFRAAEAALAGLPRDVMVRIVDFHAEASSEKIGLGLFLDGKVSAVIGTHTHVQTNDAAILPGGSAFLTDAGMCGPFPSCLGMQPEPVLRRLMTGLPARFEVAETPAELRGALLEIDPDTGRALSIKAWRG